MVIEANEKKLLADLYYEDFEKTAISSGELFEYQNRALCQLRHFEKSLQTKYPSYSFETIKIVPKVFFNESTRFVFRAKGFDGLYNAEIDNNGVLTDNFYASLIGDVFDKEIKRRMIDRGVPVCFVNTRFGSLVGECAQEGMTFDKVVMLGKLIPHDTAIYIGGDLGDSNRIEMLIREFMRSGSYRIYYSKRLEECNSVSECRRMWEKGTYGVRCDVFHIE